MFIATAFGKKTTFGFVSVATKPILIPYINLRFSTVLVSACCSQSYFSYKVDEPASIMKNVYTQQGTCEPGEAQQTAAPGADAVSPLPGLGAGPGSRRALLRLGLAPAAPVLQPRPGPPEPQANRSVVREASRPRAVRLIRIVL